jgi:hypothetical protein
MECDRPASGKPEEHYLAIRDVETGQRLARFGEGYSLASAWFTTARSTCSPPARRGWILERRHSLHLVRPQGVGPGSGRSPGKRASVQLLGLPGRGRLCDAYETDDARYVPSASSSRARRTCATGRRYPRPSSVKTGTPPARASVRERLYYLLYLEHRKPRWFFETWLARSPDLKLGAEPPIRCWPRPREDINTSTRCRGIPWPNVSVLQYRDQRLGRSSSAQRTRAPW